MKEDTLRPRWNIEHLYQRVRGSLLAKNTAWMFTAHAGRLLIQAAYFALIARTLGAEEFGAFAAALALVSVLTPFASWGSGNVLILHVARDRKSFPIYWGNAIVATLLGGGFCSLFVIGIAKWLLPSFGSTFVFTMALSEFFFSRILETAGQAFQAIERLAVTARLNLWLGISRFLAAVAFVASCKLYGSEVTTQDWALWYLSATILPAIYAIILVTQELGEPKPSLSALWRERNEGFYFSLGLSSLMAYTDLDKALLARLASLDVAGVYAAAYRIVSFAFTPIRALLAATYSRFFQHGVQGITGSLSFAKRLLLPACSYGVLSSASMFAVAPVLPHLLGNEYAESAEVIKWLSPVPLFQCLHYLAADILTSTGHQKLRSTVQVGIASFNLGLNLMLIPRYSWKGAAVATLMCEAGLAVALCLSVGYLLRESQKKNFCPAQTLIR